ncbi:hypothetical protein D3C80_1285530 [compost metagenome]
MSEELASGFNYERPPSLQNTILTGSDFFTQSVNLNNYVVSPCLYVYKKEALKNIAFYPNIVHEDNLFTTRLLLEEDIKITCIPDKLFNRRIRPESTMTQTKLEKHVRGYITVAEELLKLRKTIEKKETSIALSTFIQNIVTSSLKTCLPVYNQKFPYHIRKRAILVLVKLKHLKLKNIALCIFPEILAIKYKLKNFFQT